jgi:hypothetical protein
MVNAYFIIITPCHHQHPVIINTLSHIFFLSSSLFTFFARLQPASWQFKKGLPQLQKQHVRMVVLLHQQYTLHCPSHAFPLVAACKHGIRIN